MVCCVKFIKVLKNFLWKTEVGQDVVLSDLGTGITVPLNSIGAPVCPLLF